MQRGPPRVPPSAVPTTRSKPASFSDVPQPFAELFSARGQSLDDVRATLSPDNVEFLRQRGAAKLQRPRLPPAPKPRPLPLGTMPTNDAELAAACAALPPTERAKLDWTAEADDDDAAKSASALSEAFVAAQKELTVTQRRAAFST